MQTREHQQTSLLSTDDLTAGKDEQLSSSSVASTAILDEDDPELPFFYYQRQFNDRSYDCTASFMGKVILNQATCLWTPSETGNAAPVTAVATSAESTSVNDVDLSTFVIPQNSWYNQTIYLVVYGYSNGQIAVTEAMTNSSIFDMTSSNNSSVIGNDDAGTPFGNSTTNIRETNEGFVSPSWCVASSKEKAAPVAAVSMDASGTVISAVDVQGNCTIWTIKYSIQYRSDQSADASTANDQRTDALRQQQNASKASSGNVFSKLFWRKEAVSAPPARPPSTSTESPTQDSKGVSLKRIAILSMVDVKILRLQQYNSAIYGVPTCLCLDPYFQGNNKLLVGFSSGKIVLTSRNWMRRFDEHTILPYSSPLHDKDWIGIEALAWRGSIVAFADCSGVKLYDSISLKPIAHVDRPIGAQPSLYHWKNETDHSVEEVDVSSAVESLNGRIFPHLCFETSRSLLVAWGDCLMTLSIENSTSLVGDSPRVPEANSSSAAVLPSSRKRNVTCTMAWALDGIVASDVVPIDRRHIAILGHVLIDNDEDSASTNGLATISQRAIQNPYEVELQILDRTNGAVVYADLLQLQKGSLTCVSNIFNRSVRLLSSFSVPRMDDSLEMREERGENTSEMPEVEFVDSHFKWDLNMVSFQEPFQHDNDSDANHLGDENDTESVDSDDYCFVGKAAITSDAPAHAFHSPPVLVIVSDKDSVLARVRDLDDAIQFALDNRKPALALRWALSSRVHSFRRYKLDDLVSICLRSMLRLESSLVTGNAGPPPVLPVRNLSLRRMTLAAQALPCLLGGNINMWKVWLLELEKIPGALFLVRKYIPVRDPKLPRIVYSHILSKMVDEVESMRQSINPDVTEGLVYEAEGHVLNALLAWGTTQSLLEHIRLYEYLANLDSSYTSWVLRTTESWHYRLQQSAVSYLDFTSVNSHASVMVEPPCPITVTSHESYDSLYSIDDLFVELARRSSIVKFDYTDVTDLLKNLSTKREENRLIIDAIARLFLMKGNYDDALKCFLVMGTMHGTRTLEEYENDAIQFVNNEGLGIEEAVGPYSFVLYLIDFYHLHQCLLETNFLPDFAKITPVCSLVQLVGLRLAGEFLISNCTAPQQNSTTTSFSAAVKSGGERRGTLPIDLVAEQLKGTPKLFHWYLHFILTMKPELYVKFPTTANPPPIMAELHKKHLDLYLRFAGPNRDSAQALVGVEAYLARDKVTPLLSFLKHTLPLGTVSPIEVGKMLEIERRGGGGVSSIFALELAYIMENYGTLSESDAQLILELFLIGCQSLMLAAAFAQRVKTHSFVLWEKLIEHCLWTSKSDKLSDGSISGLYFGSLLEAAALSGADIAHLIARIPTGMQVEGLRPRLVAAVADYRLKVKLHAKANEMALGEVHMLNCESSRRLRRGVRFDSCTRDLIASEPVSNIYEEVKNATSGEIDEDLPMTLSSTLRPRSRPFRYNYSFTIPIR